IDAPEFQPPPLRLGFRRWRATRDRHVCATTTTRASARQRRPHTPPVAARRAPVRGGECVTGSELASVRLSGSIVRLRWLRTLFDTASPSLREPEESAPSR